MSSRIQPLLILILLAIAVDPSFGVPFDVLRAEAAKSGECAPMPPSG